MGRLKIIKKLLPVLVATAVFINLQGIAKAEMSPTLNNGRKWNIAYYEGGPYGDYNLTLRATLTGLSALGWIDKSLLPKNIDTLDTKQIWETLSGEKRLKYLNFIPDGFYSADWQSNRRTIDREALLERLNTRRDVDLVIAMGTWAGKDLANNQHKTPVFVMSTSDPIRAGIIKSPEDSGFDHVFARCDPQRYERQIRLFHRLFKFKKLGMVLQNSENGRLYSAWRDVIKVGQERGFAVIPCNVPEVDIPEDEMIRQYKECYRELCSKVDAVWITGTNGNQAKYIPNYIPILLENKLPTWCMSQDSGVIKRGILMALSKSDFSALGKFQAEVLARIFNGKKPRDLGQVFEDMNTIALNSKVADLIGVEIPNSIMRIANPVYSDIEKK